jgi:poly(A) polymerase
VNETLEAGAIAIVDHLRHHGYQAYWVGGCVRDIEMGRQPHDYDIATNASPAAVMGLFETASHVGAQFGVVVVALGAHHFEVSTFRTEGPYLDGRRPSSVEFVDAERDVRRRDFTINGLLHDPLTHTTIDYVGGREDLARRVVRAIGDPSVRFAEDRLRMLRALRLAAELDFTIEKATFQAIQAQAAEIAIISGERIRAELVRLLTASGRKTGLERLHASGLLKVILPEAAAMVGVPQPPEFHPEGDVFTHTALALGHLTVLTPVLAMGVLLHDIGKPPTYTVTDRIRFNRHEEVGAILAEDICRRLRFSGDETERIVELVRNHLRIADLAKMRPAKAKRFLLREDFLDHLELHRVDCLASHGDMTEWEWATRAYQALLAEPPPAKRLLTGDDLIAMGYQPGPSFAKILEVVEDAQLEGRVRTPEMARALVAEMFPLEKVSAQSASGAGEDLEDVQGSEVNRDRPGGTG